MFWNKTDPPVFAGQKLAVVRSARARRMRLAIDPRSGAPRLTLPARAPLGEALRWAETKRGWVEAQMAGRATLPIVPGMTLNVAGAVLTLDWSATHPRTPRMIDGAVRVGGPRDQLPARLLRWLKAEAKRLLAAETHEIAARGGIAVASIGIGDPVSRWGSCAASGAIRYSWRLILAPADVRRATVAHEVAHRVHMNHGRAFHALVADLLGADPAPARRWLRTHGAELQVFGRD